MKQRELLKDQAFDRLKSMILDGAYGPGTVLSEQVLSDVLGMGKAPIRSAIERLDFDGYVKVAPQQGIVVTDLSLDDIIDHFEIRTVLEAYVVAKLGGRLAAGFQDQLAANLREQRVRAKAEDVVSYRNLDTEFHMLLARAFGNREIERAMQRQTEKLRRIITRVVGNHPPRMLASTDEHAGILEAVKAGDGDRAAELMEAHLAWGLNYLTVR